jgi:hypothetical protein
MLLEIHKTQRSAEVHDFAALLTFKIAGAFAGSGIAAWFKRSARWGIQVFSGCWFGVAGAQWLVDLLKWPITADYVLFAASLMGLISYTLIELTLSPQAKRFVLAKVSAMGGNKPSPDAKQEP